jgi:hypothetical protein
MAAKTTAKTAESQTSPMDDAQTGSEPTVEVAGVEKVASGQRHVVKPGMNSIFSSPTGDSLNPAYAPISQEEDEAGVKALGLKDESQKPAESTTSTTTSTSK